MSCFGGAFAGMNQFNPMSIGNVQMPQAPLGPRAASPMNHPVQMNNMGAVPAVRTPLTPCSAHPKPHPSPLKKGQDTTALLANCGGISWKGSESDRLLSRCLFAVFMCSKNTEQTFRDARATSAVIPSSLWKSTYCLCSI